ncbi:MAG: hypothetical protein WCH40_05790 [Verrucomicrobiales bacterium]
METVTETDDTLTRIGVKDNVLSVKDPEMVKTAFNAPIQQERAHRKQDLESDANQGSPGR